MKNQDLSKAQVLHLVPGGRRTRLNAVLSVAGRSLAFGLAMILLIPSFGFAVDKTTAQNIPDIRSLPRLQAGLPAGTIAWATIEQLHPTQPQVGKNEVARKMKKLKKTLKRAGDRDPSVFSQALYEALYAGSIAPVYIAQTPKSDSRVGVEPVLGYIVDRHHGSSAIADLILKLDGPEGLVHPLFDGDHRPLNYVLVKVIKDDSGLTESQFAAEMMQLNTYLETWSKGPAGETIIQKISFQSLPERLTEMSNNPYRDLIGDLQHHRRLGKVDSDFSQFIDAKGLDSNHIVTWEQISGQMSSPQYRQAFNAAADFFCSPLAVGLPGVDSANCAKNPAR